MQRFVVREPDASSGAGKEDLSRYLKKEDRIGTAELHKKKDVPHRIRKAWDKDLKEGVGYHFEPNGKIYCGQYRQDVEEGVGEYLTSKPDLKFDIDYKRIE